MDVLDAKVRDAYSKAVKNEASDLEWVILLLDRQCQRLDAIHQDLQEVDRKVDALDSVRRGMKRWGAYVFGGVSLVAVGIGAAVRELLEFLRSI